MSQSESSDDVTYQSKSTISGGQLQDIKPEQRHLALRGAQILAKSLKAEGVDVLFGYPGGANLEIFDVLREFDITCIRTEHEQGAVHAAQGYARATGKVGVCLATSGPGATNLVTGIADANSDSTPIVAITGNVPSHLLGKNAFQEVDIVSITKPITKKSYLIQKVATIPEVVREAFTIAGGARPGPVLIDIPKDIQQHYPRDAEGNYISPEIPATLKHPEKPVGGLSQDQLTEICRMIKQARKPIIYAGGGITSANCAGTLFDLAEKLQCPMTTTIMGHGIFPPEHPLAMHTLGMHGSKYANTGINEADLVIAVGVRFDDRVTGNIDAFIQHGDIIHIDIDHKELNKNKAVALPICADINIALQQILDSAVPADYKPWLNYLSDLKIRFPFEIPGGTTLTPQYAIDLLCKMTNADAIVSLGVGQHQMWAMQHYRSRRPRSFLSSSGFGTMGYGLPAAIGAKVGYPDRQVIDIDGDGSLNMAIHELATCHRFEIGVKVFVINNQCLGMVRQWQDMIYDKHRSASDLSDPTAIKKAGELEIYPDFLKIAEGYRVKAERVTDKHQLGDAITRMLSDPNEPYLLDVIVDKEENIFPMIPAGGTYRDIIMSTDELKLRAGYEQGDSI